MGTSISRVNLFRELVNFGLFCSGILMIDDKRMKWSFYSYMFTLWCFCLLILGSVITLMNNSKNSYMYQLQAMLRLIYSLLITWLYIYFRLYRNKLAKAFSKFNYNSPNFIGHIEMEIAAANFMDHLKLHIVLNIGIGIAGVIGVALAYFGQENLYNFLYLYSCGPATDHTSTAIAFCVIEGSLGHFILNKILSIFILFFQSAMAHIGWFLMQAVVESSAAKLQVHDDHLSKCIENIENMKDADSGDVLELVAVIRNQQNVFRHNQSILDVAQIPIAIHVAFTYVASLTSIIAVASTQFKSISLNVTFVFTAIYVLLLHYTFCKKIMIFESTHEHFCNQLLELPWYKRDAKFQKFYLTLLQLNQKSHPITLFGLYTVNLKFFTATLNRLYSIVNLLLLNYKL